VVKTLRPGSYVDVFYVGHHYRADEGPDEAAGHAAGAPV
jgi:hypothetical protein